jgi:hypothetical protein
VADVSAFPGSPPLVKGGLALVDPQSSAVQRVIVLQYNPDTLSRTLQVQGIGEGGDRSEQLRLKGPPVETIKLDAELDATDQPESSGADGIHPQLAALETIVYPTAAHLQQNDALANSGTLEIAPLVAPLTLFVWSRNRIIPVRITELSVTEEAFDPLLNPIRAKVSLGLRVLSVTDVGFGAGGGSIYLAYQHQKERLASLEHGALSALGIGGIP